MNDYMNIQKVIFWEPTLSIHKIGLLESLIKLYPDIEFIYISDSGVGKDRELQGWSVSIPSHLKVIISPSSCDIKKMVIDAGNTAFHVVSGIRHRNVIVNALRFIKLYNAMFAIYSEPRAVDGFKGKIRIVQSLIGEGWIKNHAKFILAIGKHGPSWFSRVGYHKEIIYPFAYFIKPPSYSYVEKIDTNDKINVGYIGRLSKGKGFHVFLDAISKLDADKYFVTIIGGGELDYLIDAHINSSKVEILYIKCVPNDEIYTYLSKIDLLVLPSTVKDGWGVVISEALLSGVGVLVSNNVGSSILVDNKLIGFGLDRVDAEDITKKIQSIDTELFYSNESRIYRHQWAMCRLTADVGAKKLMSIVKYSIDKGIKPNCFYD